jgi:hypothetical protein
VKSSKCHPLVIRAVKDVGWLRAETEHAYVGAENMTRIKARDHLKENQM